jgi:transaldolase/glucose-6-phosphate isomerase
MTSLDTRLQNAVQNELASRIWARDPGAFVEPPHLDAARGSILNRLGWLAAPAAMVPELSQVEAFASELDREGLTEVYLLGMGGSSLCAEVLREVLGHTSKRRLVVLDTTDEAAIGRATDALAPDRACFLVASKSGSTLEVTSLEQHFWTVMSARGASPGRHFAAITDPGTSLVDHAALRGYRRTFINPPDIGGRYSALSLFGLVPAGLIGIAGRALLDPAAAMAARCRVDAAENPGLALGVFMGAHALDGRDKLTILASPSLAPLGVWIEQLVAESTGKLGRGVLPVVDEPLGAPADYGPDRAFVCLTEAGDASLVALASSLAAAGHPVMTIETTPTELGAEFFRWEFATAVAGALLHRNPFDEPDVRAAKTFTGAQLDAHQKTGAFKTDVPFATVDGRRRRELRGTGGERSFVAILDYLPADPARHTAVSRLRQSIRARTRLAVTHGIGPRYLHSTGQYHKGGPNGGLFLLVTAADGRATPVPGAAYTFSTLKQAQAYGDFDALAATGRHVVHYHLDDLKADLGAFLTEVLAKEA